MSFIRNVPLLVFPLIVYNILMFAGNVNTMLIPPIFSISLPSTGLWSVAGGDLLIVVGLLLLGVEVFKATRAGQGSIIDHSVSTLVFVVFLIEFISIKDCANSIFFILTLMTVIDVIAGFSISISSAHRDINVVG